jgi:crotonobetainyl-CoA:carnitine CoA-transferase CaiB-like acyl-CoA transferase
VGAANQRNWERLTRVLAAEELLEDSRFADNAARMAHRLELEAALSDHFRHRTTEAWLEAFEAAGLPGGPVLSIEEMHDHPQTRGREMLVATDHPVAGWVEALGPPVKLSATPANLRRPAPLLGEHTREVLSEAGYVEAEIEALIAAGDVAVPD